MTEKKSEAKLSAIEWHAPSPPPDGEPSLDAGPGQVVVTSPTGARSVVDEGAVDALKTQGYTVG